MLKLSGDSLDWALAHALLKGDTDIFPRAFEFDAIEHEWDTIKDHLLKEDALKWTTRPLRKCLSPKRRYGFRVATQLDPLDFLVFSALVYEIGHDIERHRLPIASSTDQSILSCRFDPQSRGDLFDSKSTFRTFQQRSMELAKSGDYSHVASTDIADFFHRLYLHRVEGALSISTAKQNHVKAIIRLLSQWNQTQSYGIPVGPAPARLIAEAAIDDIDKILLTEGIPFVRYMDDYRMFAKTDIESYGQLTTLANALFENHGLTLQQEKTSILAIDEFVDLYGPTAKSLELDNLSDSFEALLAAIGISDPYSDIDYDELPIDLKVKLDAMNLEDMLKTHLNCEEIDQAMVKFLLSRLSQLDNSSCADLVLNNIDHASTIFPQVIQYFENLRSLTDHQRSSIGTRTLHLLDSSMLFKLDFNKTWLFSLFLEGNAWIAPDRLASLYADSPDNFSRRKLMLALGASKQDYWFRARKGDALQFEDWSRRAFFAGSACLPHDERKHWYGFLQSRLDILETVVVSWARSR